MSDLADRPIVPDVASGESPVSPDDLAYVLATLPYVAAWRSDWLAQGSMLGRHNCKVCTALREMPERDAAQERQAAEDLLLWHGNDAIRCGVIYGMAAALARGAKPEPGQEGGPS